MMGYEPAFLEQGAVVLVVWLVATAVLARGPNPVARAIRYLSVLSLVLSQMWVFYLIVQRMGDNHFSVWPLPYIRWGVMGGNLVMLVATLYLLATTKKEPS